MKQEHLSELRKIANRLRNMCDQYGHPDWSVGEFLDAIRNAADSIDLIAASQADPKGHGGKDSRGVMKLKPPTPHGNCCGDAFNASFEQCADCPQRLPAPTPRTDDFMNSGYPRHPEWREFARKLERKLAECQQMLNSEHDAHMDCHRKLEKAKEVEELACKLIRDALGKIPEEE